MRADDVRHGSYAGALVHWRDSEPCCEPCSRAALRTTKAAKLRLDKGIRNRIPIGLAAWNVLDTVGCTTVAAQTGLGRNNLYRMQRGGPDTLVLRSSRDKILTAGGSFTAVGVWRRLRALAAIGYTMPEIAALVPCHPEPLTRIVRRNTPPSVVKARIGVGVCRAYTVLHMKPLPGSRTATRQRHRAAACGWPTPFAWDRIDDPTETPTVGHDRLDHDELDPVVIERFMAGEWHIAATRAERVEITSRWVARGRSLKQLALATGWKVERYDARREGAA